MLVGDMLRRNEKLRPNRVAITYGGKAFTWTELGDRARRAAGALANEGVRKGDRVAVLAQNCNQYVELYFAGSELGSVTTPLNYRLTASEIEYIISDSEAVALIVQDSFVPTVEPILEKLPRLRLKVCIGERRPGFIDYEQWISAATPAPAASGSPADGRRPQSDPSRSPSAPEITENDLIWQMYTSGTTGRPKGAMITHRNLCTNVAQVCMGFGEISPDARTLIVAPLYHAAAVIVSMITIAQGGCLVIKKDFIPPEVIKAFDEEGITHALLVPAMILFLLNMPGIEKINFGPLEYVMYGASAIPLEVLKKAMATFGCKFGQGFGQTESVAVLTQLNADDHERAVKSDDPNVQRLLLSCGREVFGSDVRIVGEDGRELARGEVGEIVARGDQVMKGYWKLPEATAETLRGGWLHTGDMGKMDDEGYVYIVDRIKDMIVSGGENVYPREIEEVLFQHPAVADAAVIGIPSDKWGEQPKAIVVLKPGAAATEADLVGFCEGKLAHYKRPQSIDFVASLPKNPSGKVLKRELREPYWAGKTRRVN